MMRTLYDNANCKSTVITILLLFLTHILFSQLNVTVSRTNANYTSGETATFNITSNQSGQVNYVLKYDDYAPPISSGTVNIFAGQTIPVFYSINEPGVIICQVTQGPNRADAAAVFSPFDIQPFEEEPSDFDAFWNNQKATLASVPINPVVTFFQNNQYSKTYRMQLDQVNGRRVYGYIVIPNGPGPFPATLEMPPYGDVPNLATPNVNLAEQAGVIAVSISIHNVLPNQVDQNAYLPDNFADKNESYYRWAILAGVRAIDYIYTRNDFNGNDLGVVGVSQGAGLATIIAGVDDRVKLLAMSNPVLSQNAGLKYNRAGGFPNFVQTSRNFFGTDAHEAATVNATRYYDAMFHIRRFEGPVYANLSYEDLVTPAATGFATLNQFSGKKILLHSINLGHSHPFEYWIKRQDFLRRVFPATLTTHPFPYSSNDQGYWVDAGNDLSVNGNSANLNATIEKNGSNNPNFNRSWRKVSGPGNVSFNNANAYSTTANFSVNGTYELEFSAIDNTQLNNDKKFFTLSDRVIITVGNGGGNGGGTGNNNCNNPTNLALNKTTKQHSTQFNASSNRVVDGNPNGDFWGGNSVSLTNWTNNAWWEVDLGEVAEITEIKIWNRTDCCQNILSNYHVLVSDIPFASTNLDATINQNNVDNFLQFNNAGTPSSVAINRTGRYVRVQLSGQGFLALAEVEILGCENSGSSGGGTPNGDCVVSNNLAPFGNATQSSTQFSGNANRAIDDNTEGNFWNNQQSVSLTSWNVNAWWEIDLGEVVDIDEVKIWNRTDCCQDILRNYHVLISDTPFDSKDLDATINQAGVFNDLQNNLAARPSTIPINRSGRYLRIQLAGQGFLSLAEVEIIGCSPSNGFYQNSPFSIQTGKEKLPKKLNIFPNPTMEELFVNLDDYLDKDVQLQIYNTQGILMMEKKITITNNSLQRFDLRNYTHGLYLLTVKADGLRRQTRSFVIVED